MRQWNGWTTRKCAIAADVAALGQQCKNRTHQEAEDRALDLASPVRTYVGTGAVAQTDLGDNTLVTYPTEYKPDYADWKPRQVCTYGSILPSLPSGPSNVP